VTGEGIVPSWYLASPLTSRNCTRCSSTSWLTMRLTWAWLTATWAVAVWWIC